jgi:hypothetical protein
MNVLGDNNEQFRVARFVSLRQGKSIFFRSLDSIEKTVYKRKDIYFAHLPLPPD